MTTAIASTDVSLRTLIDQGATYPSISGYLNALSPGERLTEVLAITGARVKKLYDAVADAPPVLLNLFVDNENTVVLEGRNSLPLFSRFQKRFMQRSDGTIIGFNHQTMSFITGPGYFVVKPASEKGPRPNEVYFDYTESVREAPQGWPTIKSNDSGFSRLVFMNMKDYVRTVADGVIVGRAYKLDVDQDACFTLTRV